MLFSVDIETTGLNPNFHSIFEMAIIAFHADGNGPGSVWHRYVIPHDMVWDEYCLKMHWSTIQQIIENAIPRINELEEYGKYQTYALPSGLLLRDLKYWMEKNKFYNNKDGSYHKMVACGKNFGAFDFQFIKRLLGDGNELFKYRSLDPTLWFMKSTDAVPPDLQEVKKRAEAEGCKFAFSHVSHTAVDDAMDIMHLIQHVFHKKAEAEAAELQIDR